MSAIASAKSSRHGPLYSSLAASAAIYLITAVHHAYGAILYSSPWRMHVVHHGAWALLIVLGLATWARIFQQRAAVLAYAFVSFGLFGLFVGVFEGGYNHLVKNAVYFARVSSSVFEMLFPKSIYEPPGDFIFELSGVLQFVAAMVQARLLWRLLRANGARTTSPVPGSKVALAMTLPPFDLETITGERVHIPDPSGRLVHLHFRRFAGCPICITHLRALVRRKDEIVAAGIREVIFFHSSASELLKHESDVPYDLIADPQKKYYRRFGVEKSPCALLNVKALWAALLSAIRGKGGFTVENGRLGLPADILIDDHGCVIASKYGSHAYDQWDVDELLSLARNSFLKSHRPNNAAFVDATNC